MDSRRIPKLVNQLFWPSLIIASLAGNFLCKKIDLLKRVQILLEDGSKVSPLLVEALISVEDRRFRSHNGADIYAVLRAIWSTFICGRVQGGSTIEQQLVRVITNRREKTFGRKIREISLATHLSRSFSKDELARAYLLIAYYGFGESGLEQACSELGCDPTNMSNQQASSIIARLRYPAGTHPSPHLLRYLTLRAERINRALQECSATLCIPDSKFVTTHTV